MLDIIILSAACEHGAVQLANGTYSFEGRLEVCVNGLWGTICDVNWSGTESGVVCNQLGFLAFSKCLNLLELTSTQRIICNIYMNQVIATES